MTSKQKHKEKLYEVIFEAETPAGKAFDLALILIVSLSVITVVLETVEDLQVQFALLFDILEWVFTFLFSIELALRLYCAPSKRKYLMSFFGVVDVISIIPSFLVLIIPGSQSFLVIRSLRVLRVFRILKLRNYTKAGRQLSDAIIQSWPKILVFLGFVLTLVTIIGSLMYMIESADSGFTSIPKSVYWAIVTMTTVGYGDIAPQSTLGQFMASILMLLGYGVIAVPTGLVSAELAKKTEENIKKEIQDSQKSTENSEQKKCPQCGHSLDN